MKRQLLNNKEKEPSSKKYFNITTTSHTSQPTNNTLLISRTNFNAETCSFLSGSDIEKNERRLNQIKEKLRLNVKSADKLLLNSELYKQKKKYIPPSLHPLKRENSYIPFTKVKSPFSHQSREMFLYKRIFYFFAEKKKKYARDIKLIHNKLNLEYAETDEQFDQRLMKHNIELIKKGEKIKHFSGPTFSEIQLKDLQQKVKFMKSVVDYTYPDMVLFKVKQTEKLLKIKNENYKVLEPFKRTDLNNKNNENLLKEYLNRAIKITKV